MDASNIIYQHVGRSTHPIRRIESYPRVESYPCVTGMKPLTVRVFTPGTSIGSRYSTCSAASSGICLGATGSSAKTRDLSRPKSSFCRSSSLMSGENTSVNDHNNMGIGRLWRFCVTLLQKKFVKPRIQPPHQRRHSLFHHCNDLH